MLNLLSLILSTSNYFHPTLEVLTSKIQLVSATSKKQLINSGSMSDRATETAAR